MTHWLLETLQDSLEQAKQEANKALIYQALSKESTSSDYSLIERHAEALELVVFDLLLESTNEDNQSLLRSCAANGFRLFRVLPDKTTAILQAEQILRYCALAIIGDMGADAARLLREKSWKNLPLDSQDWGERTWATILEIKLRLIRKNGWEDRDAVLDLIAKLRQAQNNFETTYLNNKSIQDAKRAALELIALYHLAKAAEIMAHYVTDGVVDGSYAIKPLLDMHFDRALAASEQVGISTLSPLIRLLATSAKVQADNSIWTVTRAVNSRVTRFVESLVNRGRGNKALFDVLPPQRRALAEQGLLGSSRRAVVVSLPTSSGKTLIAQFRILQALNQFDEDRGWVAYIAPTRALVNQVTRKLRRDFEPLGIAVEQVSPALEIDSIESQLLHERDTQRAFRVLVTTPEKLDLMLRQNLEKKVGRPLTLVVVDEAHTIQDTTRGLRLELLLATINKECKHAQFLLLTPFINNARQVARWLGDVNSQDISISIDWQPNDRIIGIVQAEKGELIKGKSYDYELKLKPQHTTRHTLSIDEDLSLPKDISSKHTYSKVCHQSTLAALTAQNLIQRGSVIVMHSRPDWVWSLADELKLESNHRLSSSSNIELVQGFLALEFGADFRLIDLLNYGIGVHHSGLSDDARVLMEWLFEEQEIDFLVATTTIAQGVNFPVAGVVMAAHQYPYGQDMPAEDFWNIAGRAGRVDQGSLGIVALVADSEEKAETLKAFINQQTGDLNSALIGMATKADNLLHDLGKIVYCHPEWSAFLQYLTHTYQEMGKPQDFVDQVEQILRGTLGFESLRTNNSRQANNLLAGIRNYVGYIQQTGQPLKLVDSTGFSLQSVRTALNAVRQENINEQAWNAETLFSNSNNDLQKMMGVLLKIPELRNNLQVVVGGKNPDGQKLASIVKDWVNGESISEIARRHFDGDITDCGKNIFGKLTQTTSWGLGALLSMTGGEQPEDSPLRNLPSRAYYGVNDDDAVVLRLLGVPRMAATPLAGFMGEISKLPLSQVRNQLRNMDEIHWNNVLGERKGRIYHKVWQVLES
jgi:superfamily II DNA/RNA helicase